MLQWQRNGVRSDSALRLITVAVIFGLVLFAQNAPAIVVSFDNLAVHLAGEIAAKDVAELKKYIGRSPVGSVVLDVNSRGGDWEAAMALGRLLRASRSAVTVYEGSLCLLYRRLEAQTREYLREMNMPESLWDAVVATPPEKMTMLSHKELETFRLSGKDPALQEVEDADAARKYGITKEVYFERKNQVWPKCGRLFPIRGEIDGTQELAVSKLTAYNRCEHAVFRGEK